MTELHPHQQRVVDEKAELDNRHTALKTFIATSPVFAALHPHEQERLRRQSLYMGQYSSVLGERIDAF